MQKCKTIVLKCVSIMRLIIAVKNPTEKVRQYILFTWVVGYFAYAQYDVLFIPYRHFVPLRLRGGRAPFVAIATFPPFQRGNLPRRRKRGVSLRAERSNLPGGRVFAKYILLTLLVGYFAFAQYDVHFTFPFGRSGANCR